MKRWTLNSWKDYPVKHIPKYEDEKEFAMVLKKGYDIDKPRNLAKSVTVE